MEKITGNLLDMMEMGYFDVMVHGCNCFHTMGAGIAGQIARRFPDAYTIDKLTTKYEDYEKLGDYSVAIITRLDGTKFIIINAYTQYKPGRDVNYRAIKKAFKKLGKSKFKDLRIAYPKIGCGIAGGIWNVVEEIIDIELEGLNHTLVEF